ncbi:MAG: sensor domain-containing diguanylate cyclase [Pseudomonadota bacterium]
MSIFNKNFKDVILDLVLNSSFSQAEKFDKILDIIRERTQADHVAIERNHCEVLERIYTSPKLNNDIKKTIPFFTSPSSMVLFKTKPVGIEFSLKELNDKFPPENRFNSKYYHGYPVILAENKLVAILSLYSKNKPLRLLTDETMQLICHEFASMIEINNLKNNLSKLNDSLENLTMTDHLTGTIKRNYLSERLDQEINRSRRYTRPLSCLLIDITNLYTIFNKYGIQFSNNIIKDVSKIIKGSIRNSDILFRYGGKEFFLILTETQLDDAFVLSERLKEKLQTHSFSFKGLSDEEITSPREKLYSDSEDVNLEIKIGFSTYPSENINTSMEMIRSTDNQLALRKNDENSTIN